MIEKNPAFRSLKRRARGTNFKALPILLALIEELKRLVPFEKIVGTGHPDGGVRIRIASATAVRRPRSSVIFAIDCFRENNDIPVIVLGAGDSTHLFPMAQIGGDSEVCLGVVIKENKWTSLRLKTVIFMVGLPILPRGENPGGVSQIIVSANLHHPRVFDPAAIRPVFV